MLTKFAIFLEVSLFLIIGSEESIPFSKEVQFPLSLQPYSVPSLLFLLFGFSLQVYEFIFEEGSYGDLGLILPHVA